jgi:hypothetical protein
MAAGMGSSAKPITRRALLAAGVGAALAAGRAARAAQAPEPPPPVVRAPYLRDLTLSNGGRPYSGDWRLFTTVSPERPGREAAVLGFRLERVATVQLDVIRTRRGLFEPIWTETQRLGPGVHQLAWRPETGTAAQTYILRLTVTDRAGRRRIYGADRPYVHWRDRAPVVRVLGVDAAFSARSYAPGQRADLVVATDAAALAVQLFRSGPERVPTWRNDELNGIPVTDPVTIPWEPRQNGPGRIRVRVGDWPSGLYYARLEADDGRVGFAPFIVRPARLGTSRAAVVLPTNTWAAYNFRDADGDGWGDSWYVGGNPPVRLDRPHMTRGVPFRFRSYDLAFLNWLARRDKMPDFLAEEDLHRWRTGDQLRASYDLVVFPGHTEYVTDQEYDVVERYRDLGGNLMFLSSNNFFWRVELRDGAILRDRQWRELGRPEAGLCGVQFLANDGGRRQASYVVAPTAPDWLLDRTGLAPGDAFGTYGIEIDARTPHSPPETTVVATIPDLFGPGRSAEMTYYETAAGAKVFSAGTMAFGGSARNWAPDIMLQNLWRRMTEDA